MAERAAAVGGKVTAGLRTGGGFEVAAWLPLVADEDGK
jgi:signal transduction histidine kinase